MHLNIPFIANEIQAMYPLSIHAASPFQSINLFIITAHSSCFQHIIFNSYIHLIKDHHHRPDMKTEVRHKIIIIDQKSFEIVKDFSGRVPYVLFIERHHRFSSRISVQACSMEWVRDMLNLATKVDDSVEFDKIRDDGDYVLIVHHRSNQRGRFLEFQLTQDLVGDIRSWCRRRIGDLDGGI